MMVAGSMTKMGAERRYLIEAVAKSNWDDVVTEVALRVNQRIREGRHARAEAARASTKKAATA